ncbi:MAG: enoyl-[acyl-carrier-protein] reductase [Deltaproteobacteria bacterium]|jgi:enoyl-[acyl-carrier protein] reductase I|nr:enoyl-[acyl-carrier-protein] reductase [Deltaproteobacteria bacterium]
MLAIDLRGKRALVAGVADDAGYGFAIAKALAEAGASICLGTWPPALGIFQTMLERGKLDRSLALSDGSKLAFERIYPFDADFDTAADIPSEVLDSKRYRELGDVSIAGLADRLAADFGSQCLDIVVHSLANAPEVKKPLLETSRRGYLAAVGTSAYSFASMLGRLGPMLRPGASLLAISYLAAERVVPGYGGGMSSAKAALESDMRTLAFEAGRKWGVRVNAISAGPLASRAANAIGDIQKMIDHCLAASPIPRAVTAADVGNAAAFLSSPLAAGITATILHVDEGYHAMGVSGTS